MTAWTGQMWGIIVRFPWGIIIRFPRCHIFPDPALEKHSCVLTILKTKHYYKSRILRRLNELEGSSSEQNVKWRSVKVDNS